MHGVSPEHLIPKWGEGAWVCVFITLLTTSNGGMDGGYCMISICFIIIITLYVIMQQY